MFPAKRLSILLTVPWALLTAGSNPLAGATLAQAGNPWRPLVEVEEDVYTFADPGNGSGPMWCSGSTCLVRCGDAVIASGIEVVTEASKLNNCRWTLFRRTAEGWHLVQAEPDQRTREPSPLAVFPDGRLFLSANPTLAPRAYAGPARPEILQFTLAELAQPPKRLTPGWAGTPSFTEHSYRSFAADGPRGELLLFHNVGYTHAEWTFRDRSGSWSAQGQLRWPDGTDYEKPQPIRICYPNVALQNRAAYFCGVSDIVEPNQAWRELKKQLTGREWDYDFRRLFYAWTPDITKSNFSPWLEVASREKTCGWISPGDLWVAPDGLVHLVWTERALDERLRERFFPQASQSYELNYARIREGRILFRHTLHRAARGGEVPSAARFQVTPENRLFVLYYVNGANPAGKGVSENRLVQIEAKGAGAPVRIPLKIPFTAWFTATPRAGSVPSRTVDLLGHQAGKPLTVSYARLRLSQ